MADDLFFDLMAICIAKELKSRLSFFSSLVCLKKKKVLHEHKGTDVFEKLLS